eukprot:COSAG04_NODE_26130_length_299_cov_0.720000_1_plen_66_part_10
MHPFACGCRAQARLAAHCPKSLRSSLLVAGLHAWRKPATASASGADVVALARVVVGSSSSSWALLR